MTTRVANRGDLWGPQHPQSHIDSQTKIEARGYNTAEACALTTSGESFPAAMLKHTQVF